MPRVGTVRASLLALVFACLAAAFACRYAVPDPVPGAAQYQEPGWVAVPFGRASVFGGNLQIARRDLDFDTRLGNVALGAVWNSADARWRYAFELTWDGATFVDAFGTVYAAAGVADGQAFPGTAWVRVDARTLRTKGGLVHEFDAAGRLAAVRFASGAYPRLEYQRAAVAGASRVVELRQLSEAGAAARLATFAYDASGRLAAVEDRAGRRAELTWDAGGRLVVARDAYDVAAGLPGFRYGWGAQGLASVASSEGVRAEYRYTTEGRLERARGLGEGDPASSFAYESLGTTFRTTVTDPLGATTAYEWDRQRRLLALVNAAGERTAFTWTGLRPASETRSDGVATRWEWTGDDLAVERQPSGNVVRFAWEPGAEDRADPSRRPLRRATDALGLVAERTYDGAGRLIRATNGAGESIVLAWSAQNLLASATDPSGIETRFREYGEHGHPRRVERGESVETREYDAVGNATSATGSAALPGAGDTGVVARGWDADRNLASIVLAGVDGASTARRTLAVTHRSDGQPLRIARPEGGDSEFAYDALGRATERRDLAGGIWRAVRFTRDRAGRIVAEDRPNGMRSETIRDDAGRPRAVAYRRGAAIDSAATFRYASGRLAEVRDEARASAPETYAYDAAGRVSAVRYPDGERLELAYDVRSRVVEERYVSAGGGELRRLRFAYDLADREVEVRDGAAPLRTVRREAGRVVEERFANGLVRSYEYGAADGLLEAATLAGAAGVVETTRLAKEPVGITWHASTTTTGGVAVATHEWFTLGPIGEGEPGPRVVGWSAAASGANVAPFAYDALGNLARIGAAGAPERTFHFDALRSRLERVRRGSGAVLHEYAYDEAGFVIVRDGEAVEWDGAGRIAAVGDRAHFRWDALGRLVSASLDGVAERRLFGGRVRGDGFGRPLAIELGALSLDLLGNHRFRHLDFRGNVKLVSDAAGRIVFHARYAPYGADRIEGAPDGLAGFAQGRSAGDALLVLGTRLYDADAARFLAPDPIFQLVNQYAYTLGNPVWYWDPDGRSADLAVTVALGVALGTACAGAVIGAPVLTIVAFTFAVGVVVPPNAMAGASTGAAAFALRTINAVPLLWGALGGFSAGQGVGAAIQATYGDATVWDPDEKLPGRGQDRELDIRIESSSGDAPGGIVGGGGSGGGTGGPSCSPTALTGTTPRVSRSLLLGLLGAQVALGAWVLARGSRAR
ncbi:MAG TPA: RHS repeat-associated core domain-containing protein [Myxococcota bacterium]|nr:RHS repeat-associated core domain-containing protein [Myxococcota bacterium]